MNLRSALFVTMWINHAQTTSSFSIFPNNKHRAFAVTSPSNKNALISTIPLSMTIKSPFDDSAGSGANETSASSADGSTAVVTPTEVMAPSDGEILDLTWENVDLVLEEMRPFLIQDGGNVAIADIDGPVVKLELQGACGTCPSSTMTMRMGLERRLKERIPEIQEVMQSIPDGPDLTEDEVNVILDGVRPFLQVAGGGIECTELLGVGGFSPQIKLKMSGKASKLRSVQKEIIQRLQKHFMIPNLRIEFDESLPFM
jgi:lysyl-tRNA synthetase class 2